MIRLDLKKEPYWIDLPSSVRLFVRPLSTAIMSAAQNAILKEIAALKEKSDDNLDVKDDKNRGLYESLLIKAVARYAIIKWEGVLSQNGDDTAPLVDQNVNDLMDIWFIAQDFWQQYTSALTIIEIEGKQFGLAQNGTLVAGQDTVEVATKKVCRAAKVKKAR